jgi:hypothetical protein
MNKVGTRVLKGIVRGKTVELEEAAGWPDGHRVVVIVADEDDIQAGQDARDTLETIYRMRHMGRSVVTP